MLNYTITDPPSPTYTHTNQRRNSPTRKLPRAAVLLTIAGQSSHQGQSVVTSTDCDTLLAGDGPCENQTTPCHVDEPKTVTHWIQQGLSGDETERTLPARVLPKTTPVRLNSKSPVCGQPLETSPEIVIPSIQQALSTNGTELPIPASVPHLITPEVLNSDSPQRSDHTSKTSGYPKHPGVPQHSAVADNVDNTTRTSCHHDHSGNVLSEESADKTSSWAHTGSLHSTRPTIVRSRNLRSFQRLKIRTTKTII